MLHSLSINLHTRLPRPTMPARVLLIDVISESIITAIEIRLDFYQSLSLRYTSTIWLRYEYKWAYPWDTANLLIRAVLELMRKNYKSHRRSGNEARGALESLDGVTRGQLTTDVPRFVTPSNVLCGRTRNVDANDTFRSRFWKPGFFRRVWSRDGGSVPM